LIVAYQAGLLHYGAAAGKDYEIGDAAHVVTSGELRIFFSVDLDYNGFAGHVGGSARDLGSGHAARTTPIGPEIHQDGHSGVLNDLFELRIIHGERLRDGRK
jgi:hypothetical protein